MAKNIRFGEYVQAVTVDSNTISYDKLMPKPRLDKNGNEITSKPEKLKLAGADIANVLKPYFNTRFMEQARAVVPLALFLALFQYIVLQRSVADATLIGGGLIAVMIGLMIFMEGLKLGLMPFGDIIGSSLPKKAASARRVAHSLLARHWLYLRGTRDWYLASCWLYRRP
jgi:hypothetical protein